MSGPLPMVTFPIQAKQMRLQAFLCKKPGGEV
jgi:hypothetical protein